ncbi:hypothetical protein WR25_01917 [Diploscapter pachys]|uniref:Anoctamin n=1 Tax=Diploscapter pachys TaxID=2018661 RepID=A0A2A2JSL5_9BILA|nr:hypothetical protein WR25_01917 [Diploscapter pachys]
MTPNEDEVEAKTAVSWLLQQIKEAEPLLRLEVRFHRLTSSYGIYITAEYKCLLKGAELCHIKKNVKQKFGGGMREFMFEEAQCYEGVATKSTFFSSTERAIIVKQILDLIRASSGCVLSLPSKKITFAEGSAIISQLMSTKLIDNVLPIHNSEFLGHLQRTWVLSLGEQPIEQIKDYFGTEIAMYFAWLGHLTTALWFPSFLGLIMFFFGEMKFKNYSPDKEDENDDYQLFVDMSFVVFALFNCIWATCYLEHWKRKQAEFSFKWGTFDVETESLLQDPRPGFRGDYLAPNPVSGRIEPFYPPWKHAMIRFGLTYPATFLCIVAMFLTMFLIFEIQDAVDFYLSESSLFWWLCHLPMVSYALIIVASDKLYRRLALFLNDLENYRTTSEYEDYLITKIALFQFVTAFGSLFYIAFILKDMKRLQETLATLLITRQITQNFMETVVPFLMERLKLSSLTYRMTRSMSDQTLRRHVENARKKSSLPDTIQIEHDLTYLSNNSPDMGLRYRKAGGGGGGDDLNHQEDSVQSKSEDDSIKCEWEICSPSSPRLPLPEFKPSVTTELTQAELESLMPEYARPLDDFLEMFIQFGYVLLFSPAFPLAALCALVNNLIEIRVDAFKLTNTLQRPFGRRVKSIGAWEKMMELLGIVGVISNCALIGQSGLVQRIWPDLGSGGQILIIVVLEHVIIGIKLIIDLAVDDIPQSVRIETAKMENYRREAFKRETRLMGRVNSLYRVDSDDSMELCTEKRSSTRNSQRSKHRSITPMLRTPSYRLATNINMNYTHKLN